MQTAKAKKLQKPRPVGRKLLGGLEPSPETRPSLQLGGAKLKLPKLLAIDTETTGVDLYHGCRPFFVSTCDADGNLVYWEWDVNPLTRNVGHIHKFIDNSSSFWDDGLVENCPWGDVFTSVPPMNELAEIETLIRSNRFVLHNTKFDTHGLEAHGLPRIDLDTVHDTLIASHVLCSNESHGLKDLALIYLDIRDDDQKELRDATNEARRLARQLDWQVAEGPHPHFPAQKQAPGDGWWIMDTWLPRMVAKYKWEIEGDSDYAPSGSEDSGGFDPQGRPIEIGYPGHPWWTVLSRYALRDVERTYGLYWIFMEELESQGLMEQYEQRRQNIAAIYQMERDGVTLNSDRLENVSEKLLYEMEAMSEQCFEIAALAPPPPKPSYSKAELEEMTKKQREKALAPFVFDNLNSPKQLETLLFDCFRLKTTKRTEGGSRSTDAEVLAGLKERTEGLPKKFVETLTGFRKRDKALAYINEYRIRSIEEPPADHLCHSRLVALNNLVPQFLRLRGSFNITGTDTTRFSSSGPNFQNISKKEYEEEPGVVIKDLNLRRMFGPAPGREWYSGDYSNIELRIFAWESGDQNLIQAFLDGYSVHLLFAELLYPEQWQKCVNKASRQLTAEVGHAPPHNAKELRNLTGDLFKTDYESSWYQWVKNGDFALIYGAGEHKADRTYHRPGAYNLIRNRMPEIDNFLSQKFQEAEVYSFVTTLGGYKLYVPTTEPHKAVNYFVQGSAGWFMCTAINRIHKYLTELNRKLGSEGTYKMIMTIHDELVFDFPKHQRNLEVITHIAKLMEQSGKPFGIPTPVQFDLHEDNWADGKKLKLAA